jgi:hypothetical protein
METAKAAIGLSDDDAGVSLMNNLYVSTDFRYKSNTSAGLLTLVSGRLHIYNAPSGVAGDVASLSERFSIRAAGDMWLNNSAGVSGQILQSGGPGGPTGWTNYLPTQWNNVTGGINLPTATGFVGIHNTTPRAPLDVIGVTSGSGNHTAIIEDDNPSIGMSLLLGYTSATGTNQRYKGFVMDNNGLNVVKALNNLTGVPASIAMFSQADNFIVGSTTDNGARGQFNGDVTVADEAYDATAWNGSLEVPTKNAVRDKIESLSGGITSINSMTGPAITITAGTGITTSSASNDVTVAVDVNNGVLPHTIDKQFIDANNSGTSETDLFTKSIAGGTLSSNGQSFTFEIAGVFNDASATANLQLYFAGTGFGGTGAMTLTGTGAWRAQGSVIRVSSSVYRANVTFIVDNTTQKTFTSMANVTSVDFTASNTFKITGTAGGGGGGSNDITAQMWQVLYWP